MADMWGRSNLNYAGSFPVDGARVSFSGTDGNLLGVGLLTQNLSVNYSQPITILFEIGTNNAYAVSGRPRGGGSMARILGPRQMMAGFYTQYGNVCNMASNILNLEAQAPSCGTVSAGNAFTLGMNNCVLTSVGVSITSENALLSENVSLMFLTMTVG